MTALIVCPLDATSAEAADLLIALDSHLSALYPPESTHLLPAADLAGPGAVFLGAFADGRLVGCCGYVVRPAGYAELKRLFVRPEARGTGVAGALLEALAARAAVAGVGLLRLETGVRQPAAVRVCERAGFTRCGPFGDYRDDPLSVFLEKRLGGPPAETGRVTISPLDPSRSEDDVPALVALLADAVEDGASVGFLARFDAGLAARYWRERIAEVRAGRRVILVARDLGRVVGAVQLALAADQNAGHRAEVQRLLVLRPHRGRGLGRALMRAVECEARTLGRTLLVLNTRAGDAPEALYARLGYVRVGTIPDFARNPDGSMNTTTVMYRRLPASGEE